MRRKDREMDEAFALNVLDQCEWAVLATVNPDGTPYCVPISPVREENSIFIHCALSGQKLDNLLSEPNVCLTCANHVHPIPEEFTTEYESCIISGRAELVESPEEKIHALRLICEKYAARNMAAFDSAIEKSLSRTAIIKIDINYITGKRKKYDANGKEMKWGKSLDEAE